MLIITSETHIIILIDAEKCLLKVNISYDKKKKHLTSEAGKRQIQHFKDIDLLFFF